MLKKLNPKLRLAILLTIGGFIITYFVCPGCSRSLRNYIMIGIFSALIWNLLWFGNEQLSGWLDKYASWIENPARRFFLGLALTIVYTLGALYLLTIAFNWITNFNIEFDGDMIYPPVIITFAISAFMHGRAFLRNWRQAALDAETFKKESAIARYESLKNQINPHFLFNSLNALTNLVYEDQDKAAKFIKQLSEVYRYVLDTREKELVTLEEELGFVQSYLFLQQIRFGSNLNVNVNLSSVQGRVAPLALQILLENAIKHNVISVDNPLLIDVHEKNGFICVINSLQKKTIVTEDGTGLGLENIKSRYKFLTDKEIEVSATDGKFSVKLPLIELEEG